MRKLLSAILLFSAAALFAGDPARVAETDLLEWEDGPALPLRGNTLELTLKPFEILTLRAEFGKRSAGNGK